MSAGFQSRRAPLLLSAYAFLVYAFLYFPIIVLVVYSFNGSGVGGFPPAHWTFDWYRQLFTDAALWDAVLNSVIVAAVAVAIALGLGLPAALALDRTDFPGKAFFRRLVLLPLILPGIITGLSLLMLFVAVGMNLSLDNHHAWPRHRVDFRSHHGNFRRIAKAGARAGRSLARPGRGSLADVLAHHAAESCAFR